MEFLTLASAHFLALLSPGVDFFIIVRTTLKKSKQQALKVCLGIASANALYIAIAVIGLETLRHLETFLLVLKYLGSLYLLYLGVMLLKAPKISLEQKVHKNSFFEKNFFMTGFLSAFLNPKNIIFYFSLFALMVSAQTPLHVRIYYGLWMSFIVLFWDSLVVYFLGSKKIKAHLSEYIYYVEKFAGGVLVFFGITLVI
jgi:threonine/homoserine/homoserine lactone efflux protein